MSISLNASLKENNIADSLGLESKDQIRFFIELLFVLLVNGLILHIDKSWKTGVSYSETCVEMNVGRQLFYHNMINTSK